MTPPVSAGVPLPDLSGVLQPLPGPAPPVTCAMPDGREGGRGGRPFSRATSSRSTWFSAFSATFATPKSATFDTNVPTRSRDSASDKVSSAVLSGGGISKVNHAPHRRNCLAREPAPLTDYGWGPASTLKHSRPPGGCSGSLRVHTCVVGEIAA